MMAVGALEAPVARDLRAHLEVCEGCRQYHEEMARVTSKINESAIPEHIEASETFHRRVTNAVRAEESASAWEGLTMLLRDHVWNWRVGLSGFAVLVVGIAILSHFQHQPIVPAPVAVITPTTPVGDANNELQPSIRNYQIAASRSFEDLDELLNKQARRNASFAPTYTAAALSLDNGAD
jgi:hypothetical protein